MSSAKQKNPPKKKSTPVKFDHSKHWKGMPEFVQNNLKPFQRIVVNVQDEAGLVRLAKVLAQNLTRKTRSVWFPEVGEDKYQDKRYSSKRK